MGCETMADEEPTLMTGKFRSLQGRRPFADTVVIGAVRDLAGPDTVRRNEEKASNSELTGGTNVVLVDPEAVATGGSRWLGRNIETDHRH